MNDEYMTLKDLFDEIGIRSASDVSRMMKKANGCGLKLADETNINWTEYGWYEERGRCLSEVPKPWVYSGYFPEQFLFLRRDVGKVIRILGLEEESSGAINENWKLGATNG
jgi:hypothetical protein